MTQNIKKQIKLLWERYGSEHSKKRELQVAALPFVIENGEVRILLITSRDTGRWVLPKGWPQKGKNEARSAEAEAWEEAGIKGTLYTKPCGSYEYVKIGETKKDNIDCMVNVFPIEVVELKDDFPEKDERELRWFSADEAAQSVNEKSLAKLLKAFGEQTKRAVAA